jgi:hypothetical protein
MGKLWAIRDKLDPGQVSILKSLYDGKLKGSIQCQSPITYKLSNSIPGQLGYGRLYGTKGSLETLEQDIRGTLCSDIYTDIDIVNCHPVLIHQLSKKLFNMDMPHLKYYITHREEFFESMLRDHNITKTGAKMLILMTLYNGSLKQIEHIPSLIISIKCEIKQFVLYLIESKLHEKLYNYCIKQDSNIHGQFLSFIVQTEERKCLSAMVDFLTSNAFQVDVLAYDGCMTRGINNITNAILLSCDQYILTKTGYNVVLKIKEMVEFTFDEKLLTPEDAYVQMKQKWEEKHFYFKPTNTVIEITKKGLCHYTWSHAMDAFNDWLIDDNSKQQLFVASWRKDSNRRNIDSLVYKKQEDCLPNEVSLFNGFAYQEYEEPDEDTSKRAVEFYKNILGAVCNDEPHVIDYVNKTFAHMIQQPFHKTGVCIIFSSRIQGVGKDTLISIIQNIIGNHVAHYIDDTQFWNKHDTMKEGAIVMYLEEANSNSNKVKSDLLKARITSSDIIVEPKGLKSYSVPNIGRYFMTTNNPDPVLLEESDRRFLLINPSDRMVQSDWNTIYSNIAKHTWIKAIGNYLEAVDLTDWNPRKFPVTEIKKDMMELTKSSEKLFLEQWKCDCPDGLLGKDLYKEYKNYCIEHELPFTKSSMSFCVTIAPYKNKLFTWMDGPNRTKFYIPKTV